MPAKRRRLALPRGSLLRVEAKGIRLGWLIRLPNVSPIYIPFGTGLAEFTRQNVKARPFVPPLPIYQGPTRY